MMKRLGLTLLLIAIIALGVTALDKSDYSGGRYFTDRHNNVILGITSTGRVDALLGFAMLDDIDLAFGSGTTAPFSMEWTTADANANCFLFELPAGGAVDVPVVGLAQADSDFGYFNGVTQTTFFIEDTDGDSYLALDFSDDDDGRLILGGGGAELGIVGATTIITAATAFDLFSPSIDLGFDTGAKMTIAVSDTTGVTAITHTGSGATMAWTVPAFTFTNSTSMSTFTPSWVLGFDAGAAMTIATTDTTGAVAITHAGSGTAVTWTADSLAFTGNFSSDGATAVLDGSTSVRGLSAGFVSLESPANRFGLNATEYMQIATTVTTGITTITHTGTGPAITWTADSLSFVGDFDSNGATAALDGSTSAKLISAGYIGFEAPDIRLGYSAAIYTKFAIADTTGNLTITHVGGSTDLVTWTAAGGFDFVGNTTVTGTFGVSGTLSVGLDATAGTLELYPTTTNRGTTTLTMADNAGDTITNVNVAEQAGARTYTVPDSGESASSFLLTDSTKTLWPFAGGLAGEDTDGAGTNGGGMVGSTVDVTTHDFNDSGAGENDVLCKVYDAGDAGWDDLSTSATLTGWAANYQLQPDAASEAINDAVAIGFDEKFVEVVFNDLATGSGAMATYAADAGKWQYSTGAGTWTDLTVFDNTDSTAQDGKRPFQRTGAITFADPGATWVVATYDGKEAYWIQWVFTAAQLTQTALIETTNKDEPIVGIPTTDSFQAPYKCEIVDVRVTNMNPTVHNQIIKFVVGNFTDGVFSAELSWAASQYSDKFALATALAADADDIIGIMVTDDAGSTQNPIWAVEFEVTYED